MGNNKHLELAKKRFQEMCKRAVKLSKILKKREDVLVVTHIDADGITSGAIALLTLERMGKNAEIMFLKQLDEQNIEKVADKGKFVWFTDLGSGQIDLIEKAKIECIISDHHIPIKKVDYQLNPHDFSIDGSYEFGGAASTYLISRFSGLNYDLSALAIVGCVGDLQDSKHGKLINFNRLILQDAVKAKVLKVVKDLRLFGKQTRPVYKMLEYTFDPYLPGISGREDAALRFLNAINVPAKDENWRRWIDLSKDEKKRVTSALVKLMMRAYYPVSVIMRLVGETYILTNEEEGTELRDAMEFSTLLNATARYGHEEIGLKVCVGVCDTKEEEFEEAFKKARSLLQNHRRNLSEGIKLVDEIGMKELKNIQYFHAEDKIMDTIVGIVAGMCYSKANLKKPIIAFANSDGCIKVSARATQRLVDKGIHLADAMRIAAEKVGGKGGGHSVAAGASIPHGKEFEFLKEVDRIVGLQLKS